MEDKIAACPRCKKRERDEAEYKSLLNRLSRIEGQIRGLRGMLEDNAYCIDVINQANAAASAISAFNKELLASHIKTCVADDLKNGEGETVDELVLTLSRILK